MQGTIHRFQFRTRSFLKVNYFLFNFAAHLDVWLQVFKNWETKYYDLKFVDYKLPAASLAFVSCA